MSLLNLVQKSSITIVEIAPQIDYDKQFAKSILSPINSIIEPLGMPEITERLSVVMNIFSGFGGL